MVNNTKLYEKLASHITGQEYISPFTLSLSLPLSHKHSHTLLLYGEQYQIPRDINYVWLELTILHVSSPEYIGISPSSPTLSYFVGNSIILNEKPVT